MPVVRRGLRACAVAALIAPISASAHGFGRLYNLPVPFWLYAWGAGAALLLSFLFMAWFADEPPGQPPTAARNISDTRWLRLLRRALPALRAASVLLLLLCIATALFGNRDPFRNFSMTFFWVVFLLGFTYLTAGIGNLSLGSASCVGLHIFRVPLAGPHSMMPHWAKKRGQAHGRS